MQVTVRVRRLTREALQDKQLCHGAAVGQQRGQMQRRDAHWTLPVRCQHVPVPLRVLDERLCAFAASAVSNAVARRNVWNIMCHSDHFRYVTAEVSIYAPPAVHTFAEFAVCCKSSPLQLCTSTRVHLCCKVLLLAGE